VKILWIALVWPEPGSSAAGIRTTQLIKAFRARGHDVEVSSPCRANEHRDKLEELGIKTVSFKPNDSSFDSYISKLDPEVVFFDRFMAEEQFGWRIREQCPNALRVLDTIDLHFLRRARERKFRQYGSAEELSDEELSAGDTVREIASIYRSDLTLLTSDFERELLTSKFNIPIDLLTLCRFSYKSGSEISKFNSRKNFVAIGNFNHAPNLDSFKLLNEVIWPKLRDELIRTGDSESELHIYGAYPTKELISLDERSSRFRVKGWAENALETLSQYRVNLAPLRFGAGIKGKVVDGWAVGTPAVGTSIAAEGMIEDLSFAGEVENDWDQFAIKAAELYTNNDKWSSAQIQAALIISKLYSEELNENHLVTVTERLVSEIRNIRTKNIVGAMLWQNQLRSTEYFSRWIEVKNKFQLLQTSSTDSITKDLGDVETRFPPSQTSET